MLNPQTGSQAGAAPPGAFGAAILTMADQLAQLSERADGLTCTYLSSAHQAAARQLRDWMSAAGLAAQIDALGNVVGRYPSAAAGAESLDTKTLIVGSHYDTVVDAGRFDGRLGILTALVVAAHLQRAGARLPFHLEVIGFAEEEGVRFAAPYIGSSAVAGCFDAALLERQDAGGTTLAALLRQHGVDLAAIRKLARPPQTLCGYLEVHIEQGPVLLEKGLPLGIVTAIAGAARFRLIVRGAAGHAGTVPMALRHDAAAAAAEIVLAVEQRCSGEETLVGTVGQLAVPHGAINVIPGMCELSLDVRAAVDATRDTAIADILAAVQAIAARRGVVVEVTDIGRHPAVPCAPRLQAALAEAVAHTGIAPLRLPSGAGHDAAMFAGVADIGMLFVRCGNGGISHSPLETVTAEDADVAARVLLDVLINLG
jgi:beta-ureidopropionase / N-carbamoyl-L-amino-acid hydrolase